MFVNLRNRSIVIYDNKGHTIMSIWKKTSLLGATSLVLSACTNGADSSEVWAQIDEARQLIITGEIEVPEFTYSN